MLQNPASSTVHRSIIICRAKVFIKNRQKILHDLVRKLRRLMAPSIEPQMPMSSKTRAV